MTVNRRRVALVALVVGCGSTPPRVAPSADRCGELFEHLAVLDFVKEWSSFGGGGYAEAKSMHVLELDRSKGAEFRKLCLEQLPLARVECGLAAADVTDAERCDARFYLGGP
jgi:hypothetical protein